MKPFRGLLLSFKDSLLGDLQLKSCCCLFLLLSQLFQLQGVLASQRLAIAIPIDSAAVANIAVVASAPIAGACAILLLSSCSLQKIPAVPSRR